VRSLSAGQAGRCAALSALADHRNRRIVSTVRERDAPSSEDELGARLAAGTVGTVRASLHHVHLPVLADAGLVEYDPGAGRVAAVDHPLLDALGDDSRAAGSGSTGEPAEESGDDRPVEAATCEVGCTSGS
jgi:hypothetical protein